MFANRIRRARVAPLWQKALWTLLVIIVLSWLNARFARIVLAFLPLGIQLLFSLFFGILQFYGLMYWLAGAKIVRSLPGDRLPLTLDDYRGNESLKRRAREWVADLRGYSLLIRLGGRPPGGVMLFGPPGCGKTYLARCMAGEAQVPFIMIDAGQLISMWLGVGILKVMQFFRALRKHAAVYGACVGFIDEIDTLGVRGGVRGAGGQAYGPWGWGGVGTLNRLLVEMDGINEANLRGKAKGYIMVIAASNRPDAIDPALLREGRFDIIVNFELPNLEGRRDILEYYLAKVVVGGDVNTDELARMTGGLPPSALEAAVRVFAARYAAREQCQCICQRHLRAAILERYWGDPAVYDRRDEEWIRAAYHEAGHVVAIRLATPDVDIAAVTCIPHLGARKYDPSGGATVPRAEPPIRIPSISRMKLRMVGLLGGLCAEEIKFGEHSAGVAADLKAANEILEQLYYVGAFGLRVKQRPPMPSPQSCSEEGCAVPQNVESTLADLITNLKHRTKKALQAHWPVVQQLAEALLERGELASEEVREICDKLPVDYAHYFLSEE